MIRIIVHGSNSIVVAGLVSIINEHANLQAIASSVDRASLIPLIDCQADLLLLERSPDEDWWLDRAISLTDFELSGILLTDSITSEEINRLLAEVRGKGKGEGEKVIFTFLFPLTFNLFPNKTEVYRTYARVLMS